METVKVSWSGGKDSTCAMLKHIEAGHLVKAVCYVPMLTDEIPLILKNHYEFILNAADKFRGMGAEVNIVTGETYAHYVLRYSKRTPGKILGFPCAMTGCCGFKRDSKVKALKNCDVGVYDYEDIGIAADETERHMQLSDTMRSILREKGISELDARRFDEEHMLLSPHYKTLTRDGCALCYNAKALERKLYFNDYPDAFDVVLMLQDAVKNAMNIGTLPVIHTPLRGGRWFIEEDLQTSMFDPVDKKRYIIN